MRNAVEGREGHVTMMAERGEPIPTSRPVEAIHAAGDADGYALSGHLADPVAIGLGGLGKRDGTGVTR